MSHPQGGRSQFRTSDDQMRDAVFLGLAALPHDPRTPCPSPLYVPMPDTITETTPSSRNIPRCVCVCLVSSPQDTTLTPSPVCLIPNVQQVKSRTPAPHPTPIRSRASIHVPHTHRPAPGAIWPSRAHPLQRALRGSVSYPSHRRRSCPLTTIQRTTLPLRSGVWNTRWRGLRRIR